MTDDPDLAALLDLAGEPALVLGHADASRPAPVVAFANRAFLTLTGLGREAIVGRTARTLRNLLRPRPVLDDLLRAVASGERFEAKVELTDERGRPVRLMLTGARLPQRSELYLVWLPTPPDAAGRTVLGEGTRPLAGLTRESFYELSVDVDCRLRLVWADPRLAELTGYTLDELHELGGFFGLVAEADRAELQRRNQRLLAGQQVVVRYKLKRKDGTPVCVRDTARPEWGPDGEVVRILGAVVDLSAERAEAPVLQIVEREAQLVAAALDAFVVLLDAQGQIRWTGGTVGNGLAERLRDNVGQNLAALLPGQALLVWLDWLEEAAERKAPVRFRFTWTEDEGGVGRTPAPASGLAEAPARRFDDATAPGGGRELEVLMTAMGEDLVQVVLRGVVERPPLARGGSVPSDLLDSLREPLLLLDPAWQIVTANDAFERLVGRVRAELAGTPVLEQVVTPGQRATVAEALTLALAKRETTVSTGIRCLARGGERPLDLRLSPVLDADGHPSAILLEAQRPSQGGAVAPLPSHGEPWFNAIIDSVTDGIVTLDPAGTITWLSRSAETIFDYPREAAVGGSLSLLLAPGAGEPAELLESLLAASGGPSGPRELPAQRRSGEPIAIEAEATALDYGGRRMIILTVRDITVRRQTEDTLKSLAYHDPLTGLPNRLLFHDRVSQAIERARRNRQLLTIMLVDLDRFKLINDSLGLEQGDQVLKAVAERLTRSLRKSDTVARLGGDEFMVLLLGTHGAEAAAKVAQKLLDSLRPPLKVNGHELTTAASIGLALFPHDGDDTDTLIKNADTALSRAKEQGRNHYQFYTEGMNTTAFERLMLESRLRKALEQEEFVVFYQPKVSLADGRVVGVEALLRWRHPDLGLVPPGEFIPLAEETGLILPIGRWVLGAACAEMKRWHRMGFEPLDLAVNLSGRQFQERTLTDTIAQVIAASGLAPSSVELELTESVIMRDAAESARRLRELTALGIRLAVDDFGTGYSSLSYLRSFPISSLKIDRSFVRDIDRDPNGAAIAQAIIALAKSLSLKVVAEGVETRGQVDLLRRYGCEEMQGFLFSRPLPAEELTQLLREGRRLPV